MRTICLCWACRTRDQSLRDLSNRIHHKYSIIHQPTARIIAQNLKLSHHTSSHLRSWEEKIGYNVIIFNIITIHFSWIIWPRLCPNTMRITLSHQLAVPRKLDYLKQPLYIIYVVIDDDLLERPVPFLFSTICKPKNLIHWSCCFLGSILICGVNSTKDNV